MPDNYWIIIKGPRFDKLPWLKLNRTRKFHTYREFDDVKEFVEQLREESPGWLITIGVTRGDGIYVLS